MIAHSDGDLFVHFSSIVGTGYRALSEGQRVNFTVRQAGSRGNAMQGRLRQAQNVELI